MTAPDGRLEARKVLLVGDTHANTRWWAEVVVPVAERCGVDAVLQVGDFGWWTAPDDHFARYVATRTPVPVWFADGNHEHHDDLARAVAEARDERAGPADAVRLGDGLWYLPRGARVRVGGLDVAVVGGARSIDRAWRSAGRDWFLAEALDNDDIARAGAPGPADVLVAHDAPAGWVIPGLLGDGDLDPVWRAERPACEEHRGRLREVHEVLEPAVVVHGHYHSAYHLRVDEPWGRVEVHGLDCDGTAHAFATLREGEAGEAVVERVFWVEQA